MIHGQEKGEFFWRFLFFCNSLLWGRVVAAYRREQGLVLGKGERRKEDGLVFQALRTSEYVFTLNVQTYPSAFSWFLFPFRLPFTHKHSHPFPSLRAISLLELL